MLTKTLLSSLITGLLLVSLSGCGGSGADGSDIASELKTPNTSGVQTNDGLISQKNLSFGASEPAPKVLDITKGTIDLDATSDITVRIGDNNNQVITEPKTILFQTEWGTITPSCTTDGEGACSVTWRPGAQNDFPSNFRNTITAYSSTPDIGQESFLDLNGNSLFDDGDTFSDLDEPFIDNDESFTFNTGDKIIDTINGVDNTGADAQHNGGDGLFNGPNCSHSSLCSTTRTVSTVWRSNFLQLTGSDLFTIKVNVIGISGTAVIQNNGADNLTLNAQSTFSFSKQLSPGDSYTLTFFSQATNTCSFDNGTTTITGIAGRAQNGGFLLEGNTDINITCI